MTPDEKRTLAALLRRFFTLMADRRALISLLKSFEADGRIPPEWREDFVALQQSPEYGALLEANAPMILRLEEAAEIDELIPMIQKLSEGKLPN